jgi:hypothetical protein
MEFFPRPRHRFFGNNFFFSGGCFGGLFFGPCGSGLWWGPGFALDSGCDPNSDCSGYGNYNDTPDWQNRMQVQPDDQPDWLDHKAGQPDAPNPREMGLSPWENSPVLDSDHDPADAPAPPKPATVIYLKDGTSYGITDYWLSGGRLHYVTNYGGENSIAVEQLNLQRTVQENAEHGVRFILSNEPAPRE